MKEYDLAKRLRLSAISGIICIALTIIICIWVISAFHSLEKQPFWSLYVTAMFAALMSYVLFIGGFGLMAKRVKSRRLTIALYSVAIASTCLFLYEIIFPTVSTANQLISSIGLIVFCGVGSILAGAYFFAFKKEFGSHARTIGKLNIAIGICLITIVLLPIAILLSILATIYEIMFLFQSAKIAEKEHMTVPLRFQSWFARIIFGIIFVLSVAVILFSSSEPPQFNKVEKEVADRVYNYMTSNSGEWKSFYSTDGHFQVLFPRYPRQSNHTSPIDDIEYTYTDYFNELPDGSSYLIEYAVYPDTSDFSDSKAVLDGALNGMIQSTDGNEVLSSTYVTFNKYPAIDVVLKNTKKDLEIQSRVILVDNSLYVIMVNHKTNVSADYDKFANSFQLLEK